MTLTVECHLYIPSSYLLWTVHLRPVLQQAIDYNTCQRWVLFKKLYNSISKLSSQEHKKVQSQDYELPPKFMSTHMCARPHITPFSFVTDTRTVTSMTSSVSQVHVHIQHAYMHTCIHAYMHTCIHAYMHTCIHGL